MKTLACVFVLLVLFLLPACEGDGGGGGGGIEQSQPLSSFDGEFYLDPAVQGSVSNVLVAVYASEGDFLSRQPMMVTRTDAQGRYFINDVPPGHYVLDALKDNDANFAVTPGDYYLAHHGCPGCAVCCVDEGNTGSFGGKLEVVK
jgi:hypothetical protein